ncbi:MAG: outer membrane beta-barrel protein [Chitinophagaceae bacterium]
MDELLPRAAEHYPLRVNESDWETIAGRLSASAETAAHKKHVAKYLRGLFVFLFLFTGGMFISREPRGIKLAATKANERSIEPVVIAETAAIKATRLSTHDLPPRRGLLEHAMNAGESNTNVELPFIIEERNVRNAHQHLLGQKHNAAVKYDAVATTNPLHFAELTISPPKAQAPKKRSGLYVGIVGGPEGNKVKGWELSSCGFDVGLVLGYDLNDRFSLETGLLFTKKHYFCEGQDFNMEMPGMKLESLEGKSRLLEIPVKLKYNVIRKRKWNVFSTAGLSSYVLTHEKNNYLLTVNGSQQNMISNYEKASKYFAAAVDVSLGYELKASPRLRLRLQPYLQIPLKGMGVGSVSVQSIGVHAGITHRLR